MNNEDRALLDASLELLHDISIDELLDYSDAIDEILNVRCFNDPKEEGE
jgi:hypothetical protein